MQPFGKICTPSWVKFVQKKSNLGEKSQKIAQLVAKFDTKVSKVLLLCQSTLIDIV